MKTINWQSAPAKKNPHNVDVKEMYNQPDAQVMHIRLKPGEGLKPHITPVDVFFYVLEGKPDIQIGDEQQTIQAETLVESPKNVKHCIMNKSDQPARILVVKTPRQQEATKFVD